MKSHNGCVNERQPQGSSTAEPTPAQLAPGASTSAPVTPVLAAELAQTSVHSAPSLLGLILVNEGVAVRICEVEAYEGSIDPGSHAYRRRTERNTHLFGPAGTAYVYLSYGIHTALNIVCGADGVASGCLVRACEVIAGLDCAQRRRLSKSGVPPMDRQLARGPGNVAQALGVTLNHGGTCLAPGMSSLDPLPLKDVVDCPLSLWRPTDWSPPPISTGPRVGVSGPGGDGEAFPWRFWITGDEHVSAYRKAASRRRLG